MWWWWCRGVVVVVYSILVGYHLWNTTRQYSACCWKPARRWEEKEDGDDYWFEERGTGSVPKSASHIVLARSRRLRSWLGAIPLILHKSICCPIQLSSSYLLAKCGILPYWCMGAPYRRCTRAKRLSFWERMMKKLYSVDKSRLKPYWSGPQLSLRPCVGFFVVVVFFSPCLWLLWCSQGSKGKLVLLENEKSC